MAKTDIQTLKEEIELHRALVLDKYPDPAPLDMKAALIDSTDQSKLKQPLVLAWTVHDEAVRHGWFTASSTRFGKGHKPWFFTEALARTHLRNVLARRYAADLHSIDTSIRIDREAMFAVLAQGQATTLEHVKEPEECFQPSSPIVYAISPASAAEPSTASIGAAGTSAESTPTTPVESATSAGPSASLPEKSAKAPSAGKRPRPMTGAEIKRKADKAEAKSKETK